MRSSRRTLGIAIAIAVAIVPGGPTPARADDPPEAPVPEPDFDWAPVAADTAEALPREPAEAPADAEAAIPLAAEKPSSFDLKARGHFELETAAVGAAAAQADYQTKVDRAQPAILTAVRRAISERQEVEPAPAAPGEPPPSAPPDDRGFLDVVAIGAAGRYHCTGILVAPDFVLTAAHCTPAAEVALAFRIDAVAVRIAVTATWVHPALDAALLQLEQAPPAVVRPRRRAGMIAPPGGTVRMVGFGVIDVRQPATFGVKRRVDAPVTGWGCDPGRAMSVGCMVGAELVVTGVGGRDTCIGDSGGPVLELFADTLRLIAITSRPVSHGGAPCGRGGVYVRVDALDAWLTPLLERTP